MKFSVDIDKDIRHRRTAMFISTHVMTSRNDDGTVNQGGTFRVAPFVFEEEKANALFDERVLPTLELSYEEFNDFMQQMADAAWNMGIRPKGSEDTQGELKATKFHLEDMRTLAKVNK